MFCWLDHSASQLFMYYQVLSMYAPIMFMNV